MVDSRNPTLVDRRTGSTIEINASPFSLGRGLGCNYVIASKVISRKHCVLEKHGDSWILEDTSTNGTYVNDKLIKSAKSPALRDNSVITLDLGDHTYIFHIPTTNDDRMDDISDEQLCLFADSVLDEVRVFQEAENEGSGVNVPDIASNHPLHDHVGMVKSQERHLNKKPKMEAPATSLTIVDVANTSTNSEVSSPLQPGPSVDDAKNPPSEDVNVENPENVQKPTKEQMQDNYEVMENELQCAICSELFIKAVTLNCAHTFCKYCIELWKKTKSECPICRASIVSAIATLVLDNVIEKVVEGSSDDVRERRKQVLIERAKLDKPLPPPWRKDSPGRRVRVGRGRANARSTPRGILPTNPSPLVHAVIEVSSDSDSEADDSSDTDSGDTSEWREEYDNDDWYDEGIPGAYYGGYGYCFSCGRRGHWANGCPFR